MERVEDGAVFSRDRRYRYRLTRRVGDGERAVTFVMLNPSKADETHDDATIRKCIGFAERWGFGVMYAVNLSPFIATRPADLLKGLPEPRRVQRRNTMTVLETAAESERIVLAYGNHASRLAKPKGAGGRVSRITSLLRNSGHALHCLGVTKSGHPRHPGRIAYETALEIYEP